MQQNIIVECKNNMRQKKINQLSPKKYLYRKFNFFFNSHKNNSKEEQRKNLKKKLKLTTAKKNKQFLEWIVLHNGYMRMFLVINQIKTGVFFLDEYTNEQILNFWWCWRRTLIWFFLFYNWTINSKINENCSIFIAYRLTINAITNTYILMW